MARANLSLSKEIQESFNNANSENLQIRILKVTINNESLMLADTFDSQGSVESDFEILLPNSLSDTDAALILFRLSDNLLSSSNGTWLLVAWVPDGCRVRDKMLYSSSREDLKRSLGLGHFKAEYATNSKGDLTWDLLHSHLDKDQQAFYSMHEKLILEEKVHSFISYCSF